MKILIVEDEPILLEKYENYLETIFEEIDTSSNYHDAIKKMKNQEYSSILVDYNLPDGNGLDIVKLGKSLNKETIFVMITAYSKERLAIESLNLGVYRYLEKPINKETLIETFKDVYNEAQERRTKNSVITKFIINSTSKRILAEEYFLSAREIEVLSEILIHSKNKIVGEILGLTQGTVRNHLSNIYQKLHISSKDNLKEIISSFNRGEKPK